MSQKKIYENELYTKPQVTMMYSDDFPLHQHRHIELICVAEGKMDVNINGKTTTLGVSDTAFIAPYVLHGYSLPVPGERPLLFKCIFEPETMGTLGELLLEYSPINPVLSAEVMNNLFPKLADRLSSMTMGFSGNKEPAEYMKVFAMLTGFIAEILSATGLEKSDKTDSSLFIKAVRICCEKYTEESFNVTKLSQMMNATPARLQQLFSKNLNLAVKEYITLLRMSKADSYLSDTDMSILDIAFHCGYGTVRSFNRAFSRTHDGKTPSEFKKICKNNTSFNIDRKVLSNFELLYGKKYKLPHLK